MDSTTFRLNLAKTYINAMEMLVEEEVDRRIEQLSDTHRAYLNRMEIIAFALNQLPSLYATGEKGLNFQLQQGRTQHGTKIQKAVQQSLSAVLRDPILNYQPLKLQTPAGLREVLKRIRVLLHNEQIDWDTLPDILEALVRDTPRGEQIAAVNASVAPTQQRTHTPDFSDDFDQDVTVGVVGVPDPSITANSDKPWKRVRGKLGASGGYAGSPTAWNDARYWK
ncbi:late competence development ComFB family protein [filamentous cyanobacterium LEGE 11480]|uniref:Late competence development ComFB family protein n=1 Tax=Romeriopsis navalis LEGE 11480 TaxID=2777977 RepID=A0A928VHL2_9CYAN|nr:late competence development ComFB family protein [Romeriopsis navalis]MBE9028761.1 late competence development ComFB family protein [Romeriopsis navalis LEGE 11480]